jgi:TetR/AcrR family transcriptional regulator
MPRPARVSPDALLAAAAVEFSARGYAGARVDRIARRARANKAMLYYHFKSKQGLYRALLRQTFTAAAADLREVAAADAPQALKLERMVAAIAAFVDSHPHFPAIMLREVAEGGVHLDKQTLAAMAALPAIVGGVVVRGAAQGVIRRVHPLTAYFTMFAPIVLYLGGAPIRKALGAHGLADVGGLTTALFVKQLQQSVRFALVTADSQKVSS